MQRIKIALALILLVITCFWLAADTLLPQPLHYFSFRTSFMQYSGIIAMGLMTVAMLLALRPVWLEPALDGLDKMYRLHKWLGITALVVSVIHWWWGQGTKWMVGWGWLVKPEGGGQMRRGAIEGWLHGQRGIAESVGEWAFYLAVLLIVLALIKRFPYHWFLKTHRLFPLAYLALVYHALILTDISYWSHPVGWLMASMLISGTVAAIISLAGQIGHKRKVTGQIESLTHYPALQALKTKIKLQPGWHGHTAGQFAFVTSDKSEGAHPYTIASDWDPASSSIVFVTKALGDHTSRLPRHLQTGMPVTVEGPYGCFDFADSQPQQIWIGAGIGITPFIARMKQLANTSNDKVIDLFHPTAELDQSAVAQLEADALAAGVRLHLWHDSEKGRLNGSLIRQLVPGWQSASIWFCGPPLFGQALRQDFSAHGMPGKHFHQELFEMR